MGDLTDTEIARRRALTKAAREKVDGGTMLTEAEVVALLLPVSDAIRVAFSEPPDEVGDEIFPRCCGHRCSTSGGFFGGRSECTVCGALIVDGLAPLHSPLLPAGRSYVTTPSDELIAMCQRAGGSWLVMHEGRRTTTTAEEADRGT